MRLASLRFARCSNASGLSSLMKLISDDTVEKQVSEP